MTERTPQETEANYAEYARSQLMRLTSLEAAFYRAGRTVTGLKNRIRQMLEDGEPSRDIVLLIGQAYRHLHVEDAAPLIAALNMFSDAELEPSEEGITVV